ncbi:NADP-dependent oxidoreductase domain-containing protein [Aspergillus alliaceus]|uniref:NADP-dependent oxidoreductase domain-containing protein n=1 Tax=Petromyces alliaceus TaxID=209559 RepID=UPI0012A3F559|nr:NADP-dependent oxidoreductase domain-containing protein [Aspergillus alliaceus]KAB8234441.1 NADP-dependent oxidoreductase domain-containing protein [Aspergillus alliaceus]
MVSHIFPGAIQVRVHDLNGCAALLNVFQKHGHNEIDIVRIYGGGSTEGCLSQLKCQERGLVMGTKIIPLQRGPFSYSCKKDDVKSGLILRLKALQTDQVDLWFLHLPDYKTPYEETIEAVNELYQAGYFKRFRISCYMAWELAQICELCERNRWKKPDVYSGLYNPIQCAVKPKLFPCLRHCGIAFYMFRPLGKGLLTDNAQRGVTTHSQADPKTKVDLKVTG